MATTTEQDGQGLDDGSEDSPVIRELRDKIKQESARRKEAEAKAESIEEEVRTKVVRELSAERLLMDAGYPSPKLRDWFLSEVEGDVTPDAVQAFLGELKPQGGGSEAKAPQDSRAEKVAGVANLSQQIASAASDTNTDSLMKKIASATSQAEVAALMAEAGLTQ